MLALKADCVITDAEGAPYLRYVNHKMKRRRSSYRRRNLCRVTGSKSGRLVTMAVPRPIKNPMDGSKFSGTYREALYRWLQHCDVRDEQDGRAPNTAQWRHTLEPGS